MRVAVLVPRRDDGGRRDEVWRWVRDRWRSAGYEPVEGHDDAPAFNRSRAINRAAADAGDWDIAVIADSDSFVGWDQLDAGILGCARDGRMWLPYDRFSYLGRVMSDNIMRGHNGEWEPGVEWTLVGTCSSQVIVRRDVWDQCRGFDEGFQSWGMEDVAFSHAAQTFGGGLARVAGEVWHLWHPPSVERHAHSWEMKLARAERYHVAAYDRVAMRALVDELHDEVHGDTCADLPNGARTG